jgi:hypothetical protein
VADEADGAARRAALLHSYGTYAWAIRTPDGHLDISRLLAELGELGANNYNFLIGLADTDWDDLRAFLPLAEKAKIRVWVTLLPPTESPPHSKKFSEPFRLDFEKWAAELSSLSSREPALVAWSIDDFAHNLSTFTPERMRNIIAAQRTRNPRFAFVPCVYYTQATEQFAARYGEFIDGILFPYRSESTKSGLTDATQVAREVETLKVRFGQGFPIVVDVYATRHSSLGNSTPAYVGDVMQLAHPIADGVHIYTHQNKRESAGREKYDVIQQIMAGWSADDR